MATYQGLTEVLTEYTNRMRTDCYAICNTAENGSPKKAVLQNVSHFTLKDGTRVFVKFASRNAISSPGLTLTYKDSEGTEYTTEEKQIVVGDDSVLAGSWEQNEIVEFCYDSSTGWQMVKGECMPVGAIYVQFPFQSAPNVVFGGTWTLQNYYGAFFRADGGDADTFNRTATFSSKTGQYTLSCSGDATSFLSVGMYIKSVSYSVGAFITAISYDSDTLVTTITTGTTSLPSGSYYIPQKEGLPNITGDCTPQRSNNGWYAQGAFFEDDYMSNAKRDSGSGSSSVGLGFDASLSNDIYGSSDHVTPVNYTIKIWKRTAY